MHVFIDAHFYATATSAHAVLPFLARILVTYRLCNLIFSVRYTCCKEARRVNCLLHADFPLVALRLDDLIVIVIEI